MGGVEVVGGDEGDDGGGEDGCCDSQDWSNIPIAVSISKRLNRLIEYFPTRMVNCHRQYLKFN